MKRIIGILTILFMAIVASPDCITATQLEDYYPYRMDTIESFLLSDYFQEESLVQIDNMIFDGIWGYTAVAFESGHTNITKEKHADTITVTFSTADQSNWGECNHIDFDNNTQLYFKDINRGVVAALSPYEFNSSFIWKNQLKLFELTAYSEVLDYLGEDFSLAPGTIIVGFDDHYWWWGDMDFDDLIVAMFRDTDRDCVQNEVDNCPVSYNPDQDDLDTDYADGIGDVCDNCPDVANPDQADTELTCEITTAGDIVGTGTPFLDGYIDLDFGEWAHAARFDFDLKLPDGGMTPASLMLMNDAQNLYWALVVDQFFSGLKVDAEIHIGDTVVEIIDIVSGHEAFHPLDQDCGETVPLYIQFQVGEDLLTTTDLPLEGFINFQISPAGDSIGDVCDNCPKTYNPDQRDVDSDEVGDVCDNCPDNNNPMVSYFPGDSMNECAQLEEGDLWQLDYDCDAWIDNGDGTKTLCMLPNCGGDECDDDDDNDGLPDWWEEKFFGDRISPRGPEQDPDGEWLDNLEEFLEYDYIENDGPDPLKADTDSDGWNDLWEKQADTVSFDPSDYPDLEVFINGIYVDKVGGKDIWLGTETYPVKSIHAAVDRLNLLEPGKYTIKFKTMGTYRLGDPEPDLPLVVRQNVIIQAVDVTIDGSTIDGTQASHWKQGIVFSPLADDITIQGIDVVNFQDGVVFNTDGGCATLEATHIYAQHSGVQLLDNDQLEVKFINGSKIVGGNTGIEFVGESSNNTLINVIDGTTLANVVENSDVGIAVMGGTGNTIVDLKIIGAPGGSAHGLLFYPGAEKFTMRGGLIESADVGIGLKTDGVCLRLEGVTIQTCRAGIEFLENYMNHVDMLGVSETDTKITACDTGILFRAGSSNNTISYGRIVGNMDGIKFETCMETPDNNRIIGSKIIDNINNGVVILDGVGNQLLDTEVSGSEVGIYIGKNGHDNLVRGGSIWGNSHQNFMVDGNQNQIENISIQASGETGIGNISGNTTLSGLTINGNATAVYGMVVEGPGKVILDSVIIQDFDIGIGFSIDGACLQLRGSKIQACGIGIDIREKYLLDIDLFDSQILNCNIGIEVAAGSSNNTIRNGIIALNSLDGILVDGCSSTPDDNSFINVVIKDNGRHGIAFMGGFGNQLLGGSVSNNNTISQNGFGGVAILNGSASIVRSKIYANGCHGVYMDEAVDVDISGNLIFDNPEGVRVGFVSNATIASNTIADNDSGLIIEDGALPYVTHNIIYSNGSTGLPNDIFLEGAFEPTNLVENDIGSVNQIDLPPTNISVDPKFNMDVQGKENYTLQSTSPCIDGTTKTEPGLDIGDRMRPRGFTWDMGAFESSSFADTDDDGLPDWWENHYFGSVTSSQGPLDDDDDDGISNLEEFLQGSDPTVPVYVAITIPVDNPYFTAEIWEDIATISGVSTNADSITISKAGSVTPDISGFWSAGIDIDQLDPGHNVILVTASGTVDDVDHTATDTLTIIKDDAVPTLSITSPEPSTTLSSISISGIANDDTAVSRVTWERFASPCLDPLGPDGALLPEIITGEALGAEYWNTGPVQLCMGENRITIIAEDIFDNPSEPLTVYITQNSGEAGVTAVEEDLSGQGTSSVFDDPLDIDGDGYTNDDEIACGSDPLCDVGNEFGICTESGLPAIPANTTGIYYPSSHEKEDYLWPDCLNPDIDQDGLPNWWEEQHFGGSTTAAEPSGNEDDDAYSNLEEYTNGTDPNVHQTVAFNLQITETSDSDNPAHAWLPKYGHWVKIEATWIGNPENPEASAPANAVFSLKRTSTHPGRAVNDPNPVDMTVSNYPTWYYDANNSVDHFNGFDFGLTEASLNSLEDCATVNCFNQGEIVVPNTGNDTYVVFLNCFDFGASANVLVTDDQAGNTIGQMWVPQGSDKNGIGNTWEFEDELNPLNPNGDTDSIVFTPFGSYNAPQGDDFSHFEEYRGIVFTDTTPGLLQPLIHKRLNPHRKDLFIRASGFDGPGSDYTFGYGLAFSNAGIDVHNTTGWGHDATEDGSFYVYYREGDVSSITTGIDGKYKTVVGSGTAWPSTWPRHEWEFKLVGDPEEKWTPVGYWSGTGNELGLDFEYGPVAPGVYPYEIRKPMPHINILIIRHEQNATFGNQDGRISFISASPPSPQNPLGTRYWHWSTKGYAWCQTTAAQPTMYGLAVSLQKPLDHYFSDKPYLDGSTWDSNTLNWGKTWDETAQLWVLDPPDGVLNPLSLVEDQTDQLDPIDGVLGDVPDGYWDGDKRLGNYSGNLNPFDIDSDGLVELPLAFNPKDILSNEYNKNQVLIHTITHEIGHALAGPSHTNDPDCLMYKYSNNWDRADFLSDYYRSILRIHNLTR